MNVHEDKILLLTSFATAAEAKLALDAGVLGAVVKDSPSETIIKAIRTTVRGLSQRVSTTTKSPSWSALRAMA